MLEQFAVRCIEFCDSALLLAKRAWTSAHSKCPWRSYNINQLDALISEIYFLNKTLHVSDSSSVHHQEFFTVHTATHTGLLTACSH